MSTLVVRSPFLNYQVGDQITDPATVASLINSPDYENFVINVGTTSSQSSSGTTTTTLLTSNKGAVITDGTTLAISSDNVLYVVPSSSSAAAIASSLGYTPANSSQIGQANGIASLDSAGKLIPTQIPSSLSGVLNYVGTWDAFANNPGLLSGVGTKGTYYKVSVAGSTPLDGNITWSVGDYITFNGTTWDRLLGGFTPAVTSFNSRTGLISLQPSDVTTALGFTPYNTTNPSGYINAATALSIAPIKSFNGRTGSITLAQTDVANALGFTPYNASNPAGYITASQVPPSGVTTFNSRSGSILLGNADVTTALGFTPYNASNPAGYITASQAPVSVSSVAGRTGVITLTATDVSGLARISTSGSYSDLINKPIVPSSTSQLTNDAGFVTTLTAPVTSVNGQTGTVALTTSAITNDAGFVTSTTAPVTSVNGFTGAITLAQQDATLLDPNLSYFNNDVGFINNTSNVSTTLVTVNGITNTLAVWLAQVFAKSIALVLNTSGGDILMSDGSILSVKY